MNEHLRREYLDALGIDVWLPKGQAEPESGESLPDSADRARTAATHAPAGESSASLDELRQMVAACTRCALAASRTQTVFGVGNRQADWMIIGEAPGAEEDRRGAPFVGRAGKLLDEMLRAIGLGRDAVFIANILKCRPPNNRDPKADEAAACRGYLNRQIELIAPRILLVVGRIAAQQLLASDAPVGRMRGKVHHLGEIPVIVTYHPAYLLRQPTQKRAAWDDLRLAMRTMSGQDS